VLLAAAEASEALLLPQEALVAALDNHLLLPPLEEVVVVLEILRQPLPLELVVALAVPPTRLVSELLHRQVPLDNPRHRLPLVLQLVLEAPVQLPLSAVVQGSDSLLGALDQVLRRRVLLEHQHREVSSAGPHLHRQVRSSASRWGTILLCDYFLFD